MSTSRQLTIAEIKKIERDWCEFTHGATQGYKRASQIPYLRGACAALNAEYPMRWINAIRMGYLIQQLSEIADE